MKFVLVALAALALSTIVAEAQPGAVDAADAARGGIAAEPAKAGFSFAFAEPYYHRLYYDQPYYATRNRDPGQNCHRGSCD